VALSEPWERREAWAGFVAEFPWDWFATLTFRGVFDRRTGEPIDVPVGTAHGLFRGFCEDIGTVTARPIMWFRCDEVWLADGAPSHACVGGWRE
jgi:hypothetical protein